jgi:predicted ThiF/HesA family dinucleotide-utilizing enzyme
LEAVGNARTTASAGAGRVVVVEATVVVVTGTVVVVTAAGGAVVGVAAGLTGVAGSVGAGGVTGSAGGVTGAGSADIPSNTSLIMLVTCRNSGPCMLLELIASKNTPDDVTRGSCG